MFQLLLGLLLFGCLASVWRPFAQNQRLARASESWPKVRGQIVEWVPGEQTALGTPKVEYAYRVGEATYHASTISFGLPAGPRARQELARYQQNDAVWVAYDPANPAQAVLYPGGSALRQLLANPPALLNLLFSGLLTVIFLALLIRDLLGA
ncbi:MAG: DUF3592 domain-containing protein [Roseiflexaceae bacterium]|nr:DUF3592 domain-containing protein [Roseiflexaceae bacterium]